MTTIKPRSDTTANWTLANPVMAVKEIGLDLDAKRFKIGDGVTPWTDLLYWGQFSGTATITVPNNALEHEETFAALGVAAASVVNVWLAPQLDSDENSPEMLDLTSISATPGADTLTVFARFFAPSCGPIKLNWSSHA